MNQFVVLGIAILIGVVFERLICDDDGGDS